MKTTSSYSKSRVNLHPSTLKSLLASGGIFGDIVRAASRPCPGLFAERPMVTLQNNNSQPQDPRTPNKRIWGYLTILHVFPDISLDMSDCGSFVACLGSRTL